MPCIVFKRELEAACPELPAFLSEAGNSKALVVEPSLPSSVTPVQKLEQVATKTTGGSNRSDAAWAKAVTDDCINEDAI